MEIYYVTASSWPSSQPLCDVCFHIRKRWAFDWRDNLGSPVREIALDGSLVSAKETKGLAMINSAIALGGVFSILVTARGIQAGIYSLYGVIAVSCLIGPLALFFGVKEGGESEGIDTMKPTMS